MSDLVQIALRSGVEIIAIAARKGAEEALGRRIAQLMGLQLPHGPSRTTGDVAFLMGVAPRKWLLVSEPTDPELEPRLARELAGLASVCLQSDAYRIFRVAGPAARATLAKGVPVDLHPDVFGPSAVAVTLAAHMGVILWRADAPLTFDLAVFRSHERSASRWLHDSAAEFSAA